MKVAEILPLPGLLDLFQWSAAKSLTEMSAPMAKSQTQEIQSESVSNKSIAQMIRHPSKIATLQASKSQDRKANAPSRFFGRRIKKEF
jgi:hypothetical protein